MKKVGILAAILAISCSLCGCCLEHEWAEATCTEAKICVKCGKTHGEPLGHVWQDATCDSPKTCSVCALTEGEPLGHTFTEATEGCTTIYTCSVCGYSKEETQHEWEFGSVNNIENSIIQGMTLVGTVTCSKCGETKKGSIKYYSAEGFGEMFCAWIDLAGEGSYDDLVRSPEEQKNYVMKFTGYIVRDCGDYCYIMATSGQTDDEIFVEFVGKKSGESFSEGDSVTAYGRPVLFHTYTNAEGETVTIPRFTAYYLKLLK